jgi:hypothetical protein
MHDVIPRTIDVDGMIAVVREVLALRERRAVAGFPSSRRRALGSLIYSSGPT